MDRGFVAFYCWALTVFHASFRHLHLTHIVVGVARRAFIMHAQTVISRARKKSRTDLNEMDVVLMPSFFPSPHRQQQQPRCSSFVRYNHFNISDRNPSHIATTHTFQPNFSLPRCRHPNMNLLFRIHVHCVDVSLFSFTPSDYAIHVPARLLLSTKTKTESWRNEKHSPDKLQC